MIKIKPFGNKDLMAIHVNGINEFSGIKEVDSLDGSELFIMEWPNNQYEKIKIQASNINISGSDPDAFHSNKSHEFLELEEKLVPIDTDIIAIEDSQNGYTKKSITIGSIVGGCSLTMDTIPQGVIYNKVLAEDNIKLNSIASSAIDIDDAVSKRHTQGTDQRIGPMTDIINMNNFRIINLPTPVNPGDAANKDYVDAIAPGDPDAFHKNLTDEIAILTIKSDLVNGDYVLIEDSENLNEKRATTIGYIHSTTNIDEIQNGTLFKKIPTLDATKLSSITSSAIDIDDAVSKKHTQGTDTTLGILTTNINLGNNMINNSALPILDTDLASKGYVDSAIIQNNPIIELFRPIQDANFPAAVSDPGWSQYLEVNRAYFSSNMGGPFIDSILLPDGAVMFSYYSNPGQITYITKSINNSTNWTENGYGTNIAGYMEYGTFPSIYTPTGNITNVEALFLGSKNDSPKLYALMKQYTKVYEYTVLPTTNATTSALLGLPKDNSFLMAIQDTTYGALIIKFRDLSIVNGDGIVAFNFGGSGVGESIKKIIELYEGLIYSIVLDGGLSRSFIFKSENNGDGWAELSNMNGSLLDIVYCGDNKLIGILIPQAAEDSILIKSIDKGLTWQPISNIMFQSGTSPSKLRYLRKNTILATGGNTWGAAYISTDNGDNFYKINDTYSGHKSLGRAIQNTDGNIYVPSISDTEGYKIWRIESSPQVIKKSFMSTDFTATLGSRRVRTIIGDGSSEFDFVFPKDFIRFGTYGGIYLYCIPTSGAAQSGRNIDLLVEYDNGPGTLYDFHTESDTTSTYNLTGTTSLMTSINFTHLVSSPGAGKTGGIKVDHNVIGGSIHYLGIEIVYL